MTRSLSAENLAALQARRLEPRDFITFIVREWGTGNAVSDSYWSDVGDISAEVIDPDSGAVVTRTFRGASALITISDIALVSTLTVQQVTVTLAQVATRVNDLVRGYDCKQGKVQIFRGLFDPDSRVMVAPAVPRFAGTIDEAPIKTPKEGESGDVVLTCTGNTQELTRSNSDTRSDASQRLRSADDDFYADVAVVGSWQQFWGREGGVARATRAMSNYDLVRAAAAIWANR